MVFVVDEGLRTLADFRYKRKYVAKNGDRGQGSNKTGKSADNIMVRVPGGTIIKDMERDVLLADLISNGQSYVVAKGGRGGRGNQHFATATRQVPSFSQRGEPGEEKRIMVELKLLGDIGLVGYPNVGKSTILSQVSNARPKIANYPFTTLTPNLGVVHIGDGQSFVLADIPGLIEGAGEGLGLGHDFLKHIERTRLLIHVIDIYGLEGRDPMDDFITINHELKGYSLNLEKKPQMVAANKMDLLESPHKFETFKKTMEKQGIKVYPISAATGEGLNELMLKAYEMLIKLPEDAPFIPQEMAVYKEEKEVPFIVRRDNEIFIVEGIMADKILRNTNIYDYESLQYFQRSLIRSGIIDALKEAGIKDGDTVMINDFSFDYLE